MINDKAEVKFSGLISEMAKFGDTQETLAELLGVSKSGISRRLSGEIQWSIGEIEKICNYYKKDYYELFTDKDEPKIPLF